MKFVRVEWIDAHSSMDSITVEELIKEEPFLTESVGCLMHEDKEKIILSFMNFGFNINESPLIKHYQVIPKGIIKEIIPLADTKKLKKEIYEDDLLGWKNKKVLKHYSKMIDNCSENINKASQGGKDANP